MLTPIGEDNKRLLGWFYVTMYNNMIEEQQILIDPFINGMSSNQVDEICALIRDIYIK
jgi:hypothetical protein